VSLTGDALGSGGWVVDSFFDITYRIEFAPAGQPRDGSLVLTNLGGTGLPAALSQDDGVISPFTWSQCFPGGDPAPGLVLGATETELTPFWMNVADGSILVEQTAAVPEPTTMTLLSVGAAWLICRRRKRKAP
jgi:hypothetical protein